MTTAHRRCVNNGCQRIQICDGPHDCELAGEAFAPFQAPIPAPEGAPASARATEAQDTERLNWLDSQGFAYGFQDLHEGNRWVIEGPFANLRKAIDAGIAAEERREQIVSGAAPHAPAAPEAPAQSPAEGGGPPADAIAVNLMRLAGLNKHKARECEAIVRQVLAAQPNVQPKGTEPESDGDLRRRVLDVAKAIGLIDWVSDDRRFFTFAGDEAMSSKLVDLVRLTAAPSPAPAPAGKPVAYLHRATYPNGAKGATLSMDADHPYLGHPEYEGCPVETTPLYAAPAPVQAPAVVAEKAVMPAKRFDKIEIGDDVELRYDPITGRDRGAK